MKIFYSGLILLSLYFWWEGKAEWYIPAILITLDIVLKAIRFYTRDKVIQQLVAKAAGTGMEANMAREKLKKMGVSPYDLF